MDILRNQQRLEAWLSKGGPRLAREYQLYRDYEWTCARLQYNLAKKFREYASLRQSSLQSETLMYQLQNSVLQNRLSPYDTIGQAPGTLGSVLGKFFL